MVMAAEILTTPNMEMGDQLPPEPAAFTMPVQEPIDLEPGGLYSITTLTHAEVGEGRLAKPALKLEIGHYVFSHVIGGQSGNYARFDHASDPTRASHLVRLYQSEKPENDRYQVVIAPSDPSLPIEDSTTFIPIEKRPRLVPDDKAE